MVKQQEPSTSSRHLALLMQVIDGSTLKDKGVDAFPEAVFEWERQLDEYQIAVAKPLDENVKMSILLRNSPIEIREHLLVNGDKYNSYVMVREAILAFSERRVLWQPS